MFFYLKQALKDFKNNRFLHTITIITVCFSVLIIGTLVLFIENANGVIENFKKEIRIIAYLDSGIDEESKNHIRKSIETIDGISDVVFISSDKALDILKNQMRNQSEYLDDLNENLLPASFEIYLKKEFHNWEGISRAAEIIESVKGVNEVEYGKSWLGKFTGIISLFQFASLGMGLIFFLVTIFIIINTIRLSLYSRKEEIEIMRLVGAEDSFIKRPFYYEGILQGLIGGFIGIFLLFILFQFFSRKFDADFLTSGFIQINFLSFKVILEIILGSITAGWLGCYISVRQFLKN